MPQTNYTNRQKIITESDSELINKALYRYWSYCVNQVTRKRTMNGHIDSKADRERKQNLRDEWHAECDRAKQLMDDLRNGRKTIEIK
jgi:hypothetical protein